MNLVLTIAIGEHYFQIAQLTHPTIKAYANRIGADFISITEQSISRTTPHWEKFHIYDLLKKYDRVLYVDTDLIIRDDCPNLFEEVPIFRLGAFDESRFTDRSKELLIDVCKAYGVTLPWWNGKYYNTGVMVISRCHRELFKKPDMEICNFYEQSYLNMMIAKMDIPMYDLHYRFNRMTCMDRFTGEDRFASYIIHYAGYPSLSTVKDLVSNDLERWKRDKPNGYRYKKHVLITANGGLGDQVEAEPAIRFMRKNLYPEDEMVVVSHWPRIFEHLREMGIELYSYGEFKFKPDTPYYSVKTLPEPDSIQWFVVSHLLCHTVDYSAMALMKRTLPNEEKTIKLKVFDNDRKQIGELVVGKDIDKMILVHPGKHWESKTFPSWYWQKIIDKLDELGYVVVIIGKDEPGDPPTYEPGKRGTVDVECPRNGIDLRNLLSIGELLALLDIAPVLISNDSAPVHLAGAFDNWIILIPSCKHPDHVLPWRKGSVYYKAKALYKKLIIDDVESRPTQVYETSVDVKGIQWEQYLPDTDVVINGAVYALRGD